MMPPKQTVDNSEHGKEEWDDPKDFHREGETLGHFEYNPAAEEITAQHRDKFPEVTDFEPPEKM
jgi:hypothetical protein